MAIQRYVGLGKETTWGTAVAATRYIRSVENIIPDPGFYIPDPIIRRSFKVRQDVQYLMQGSIGEFDVRSDNLGEFLHMILGDPASVPIGVTAVRHIFHPVNADTLPHYTVRAGVGLKERIIPSMLCQRLTFKFGAESPTLTAMAALVGRGPETDGTLATLTEANFSSQKMFSWDQFRFQVDTVTRTAHLFSGEITIENVFPLSQMRNGGSKYLSTRRYGNRKVTGRVSLAFDDTDERDLFLAQSDFELNFRWRGASLGEGFYEEIEFLLPECNFLKDTSGHVAPINQPVVLNAPFQAFYKAGENWDCEVEIWLWNTIEEY